MLKFVKLTATVWDVYNGSKIVARIRKYPTGYFVRVYGPNNAIVEQADSMKAAKQLVSDIIGKSNEVVS